MRRSASLAKKRENAQEEIPPSSVVLGEEAATSGRANPRRQPTYRGHSMSKFAGAVVAAVALSAGFSSLAGATEYKRAYCAETQTYCQYKKVVCYKTVTDYRTVTDY